jgi:hypothetical protein
MSVGIITHTVNVHRLTKTGNNTEYGASPVISGLDCSIFPASTDTLAVYPDLPAYATYEGFTQESATLKLGDKLKVATEEFIIRGVPQVYDTNYAYYQRFVLEKVIS